jgi:dihydropyrimidine dehydrogenase (NAD+) subunit PreA
MPDLSVDFVGIHFPNPYMLASATPTRTAEMIKRAFAAGWGGAVTKTIVPEPVNDLQPRLQPLHHSRRKIGMENIKLTTQLTLQDWQREIADIKAAYPDRPLWASIMGAMEEAGWQGIAETVQEAGADALELNVSFHAECRPKGWGLSLVRVTN